MHTPILLVDVILLFAVFLCFLFHLGVVSQFAGCYIFLRFYLSGRYSSSKRLDEVEDKTDTITPEAEIHRQFFRSTRG